MKWMKAVGLTMVCLLCSGMYVSGETESPIDSSHFWTYAMAASAPNGCYSMETSYYGSWLTYIDDQSGHEVYLCGKPECEHGNMRFELSDYDPELQEKLESCNAYVGNTISQSVYYKEGYVYYIGYNENTYDLTLERVKEDGSLHEEITVVGQCSLAANIYTYVTSGDFSYFAYMPFHLNFEEERTADILKIDLTSGESEILYSYEDVYATISSMSCIGTKVYFLEGGYDEDGTSVKTLRCVDTESGEISDVLRAGIYEYTVTEDGTVYYFTGFEGVHLYDPRTEMDELIWECGTDSEIVEMCYDGTYLYLDNYITQKLLNDSAKELIVLDKDGTEVNRIDMEGYQSVLVNGRYLLAEETELDTGHFWTYAKAASAENGCYTLENGFYGGWLTYIDDQSGQEVYLCGKPDCIHEKLEWEMKEGDPDLEETLQSCNAYVGSVISFSVYYQDGYVYYLGYDRETYDVSLERSSVDGSVHESIATVGQSSSGAAIYSYAVVEDSCYFAYMPFTFDVEEERTAEILQIDLNSGAVESIYQYEDVFASFSYLKRHETDIYFLEGGYDADGTARKTLKCLNTESGEIHDVLREAIYQYSIDLDGTIFYFAVFDGVHRYDPDTGEDTLIWECEEESAVAEMCFNGEYLFLDNYITNLLINESPRQMIVLDKEGKERNRLDMENRSSILVNSNYLLAEEEDVEEAVVVWTILPCDQFEAEDATWVELQSDSLHSR